MKYRLASTAHFLTINVAEWQHDPVITSTLRLDTPAIRDARSERIVGELLDRLSAANSRATFFVGRSVALVAPAVARQIARAGHELAAHGEYAGHDWRAFQSDAAQTRQRLEDLSGVQVRGFRSPRIAPLNGMWRFELLIEEGFEYDSSRVAGARRDRSIPRVPLYPQLVDCPSGGLVEVPLLRGPLSNSAISLRHAPYSAVHSLLADRTRAELPAVLSFATWEVDESQPTIGISKLAALRYLGGRHAARERLTRLLREFRFGAVGDRLTELAQAAPASHAA